MLKVKHYFPLRFFFLKIFIYGPDFSALLWRKYRALYQYKYHDGFLKLAVGFSHGICDILSWLGPLTFTELYQLLNVVQK